MHRSPILTGTSDNVEAQVSLEELGKHFDLSHVSKSSAKFDPAELIALNKSLVHRMSFQSVQARLADIGISGRNAEAFWMAVRPNLEKVRDAADWWQVVTVAKSGDEKLSEDDIVFVRAAFDLLPEGPFDQDSWRTWTSAVKSATGRSGKSLFMPLRVALTGRSHGRNWQHF